MVLFSLCFMVSLISFSVAEINNYAPVEKDSCVTIRQVCASCSYVNVTVSYPNSTIAISNTNMTNNGGGVWTYEFCNTSSLGRYDVNGMGDLEGTDTGFDVLYFDVTPSGADNISEGQSSVILISLIVMLAVGLFFFFLFAKTDGMAWKIIFGGTSFLVLIMCVLYSMVLMDQNLGTFSGLVNSYATFWQVVQVIIGISILTLLLYGVYKSFKMWQIKRGFRDE